MVTFTKELIACNRQFGFLPGSSSVSNDLTSFLYHEHKHGGGCIEKGGPWAMFEASLTFGHEWLRFDWFNSEMTTKGLQAICTLHGNVQFRTKLCYGEFGCIEFQF